MRVGATATSSYQTWRAGPWIVQNPNLKFLIRERARRIVRRVDELRAVDVDLLDAVGAVEAELDAVPGVLVEDVGPRASVGKPAVAVRPAHDVVGVERHADVLGELDAVRLVGGVVQARHRDRVVIGSDVDVAAEPEPRPEGASWSRGRPASGTRWPRRFRRRLHAQRRIAVLLQRGVDGEGGGPGVAGSPLQLVDGVWRACSRLRSPSRTSRSRGRRAWRRRRRLFRSRPRFPSCPRFRSCRRGRPRRPVPVVPPLLPPRPPGELPAVPVVPAAA